MSLQYNRLKHRFSEPDSHGVHVLTAACKSNRLTDTELKHLCDRVFTEASADAALVSFLKAHGQGEKQANAFLFSLIPPRTQSDDVSSEGWLGWVLAPFRHLARWFP
ncbi:MAG: hypothetical protein EXS51_02200 [Candidatus Taylorbacteria bacterium]|nr:hypothetical protein [Candidatus Taylorbacteria bacterium]